MRLVDADALFEKVKESSKDAGFYTPIYNGFLASIVNAPTIEQPTWISCEERLPEFYKNEDGCLCTHGKIVFRSGWDKTVHLGYCIKLIYIIDIDSLETIETIEWYDDTGCKWENITDWMPLPKGDE